MAIFGGTAHRCTWKRGRGRGTLYPSDKIEWLGQTSSEAYSTTGLFKFILLHCLGFGVRNISVTFRCIPFVPEIVRFMIPEPKQTTPKQAEEAFQESLRFKAVSPYTPQ